MLGLCVNTYVEAQEEEAFQIHRAKASTMDIKDLDSPRDESSFAAEASTHRDDGDSSSSDDEPYPPGGDARADAILAAMDIRPILSLAPEREQPEPQGTPAAYTGSSAGTTLDVIPVRTPGADVLGTPGGCSTSVSPKRDPPVIPKLEVLDVLDQRTRPSLDRFRDARRKMQKLPYAELPRGSVIEVSDDDEGDVEMMKEMGVKTQGDWTKDEALSVAELNRQLEEKMREKLAAQEAAHAKLNAEQAAKISALQEQVEASNAKQDRMLELLSRMANIVPPAAAFAYPPAYPPHYLPPGPYGEGTSSRPAPHPTPVVTPPTQEPSTTPPTHDAISAAINEAQGLRTLVRESPGQGRPDEGEDLRMEEGSPAEARRVSDVHMEALDLGGDDDDIQQTQTSRAERAAEDMETETAAAGEDTNARSSIAEGADDLASDPAPPADDEVTHP